MIVDSHCHLDYPELYNDLDSVLKRAKSNQVQYLLSICTTPNSFEKIKLIVNKYENIYGTFGIHPHETSRFTEVNSDFIIDLIENNKKIIGIGETGLDFYYNHSETSYQKKSFEEHIQAALKLNLPIVVHSRNAEHDTYEILKAESKNKNLKILIHCFTGSKEFAKKLLELNTYFSVSGIITFKNSSELNNTISFIPNENLLIETDSPYLAPHPYRGKPNEPSYITYTLQKLSEIKKVSKENIMNTTTKNFKKLFNII